MHDIKEKLENQGITVQVFNEPMTNHEKESFLNSIDKKNYILKVHAHDLKFYPQYILDMINNNSCFLVRIRRKSFEDQIISHCIAVKKNIWGYYNQTWHDEQLENGKKQISITTGDILTIIKYVKEWNKVLDNFPAKFDLDLIYEDIDIKSTHLIKTPKPENYNFLKKEIKKVLQCLQKEF
jgi:hypothetical protein